jgi:hypothetical protein
VQHLLFDKSAFQAIGDDMHERIRTGYNVVTAPTLLYEIAGDLKENREFKAKTPEQRATTLAKKFGDRVETHRDWWSSPRETGPPRRWRLISCTPAVIACASPGVDARRCSPQTKRRAVA